MNSKINMKGAAKGAFIGGIAAGVVGIVIFFIFSAIGATYAPRDPAAMGMTVLPFFQPMIICMIATVVSIGILALLNKIAPAKAWTIYLVIAVIVFLIEAYMPFWAFTDMKTIIALELMHFPPTIGIVGGIYKYGVTKA